MNVCQLKALCDPSFVHFIYLAYSKRRPSLFVLLRARHAKTPQRNDLFDNVHEGTAALFAALLSAERDDENKACRTVIRLFDLSQQSPNYVRGRLL